MHGYELLESMEKMTHPGAPDTGGLYRLLRTMEEEGLLESNWDAGESGPARRIYSLTPLGEKSLDEWMISLKDTEIWLQQFLIDYQEYKKQMEEVK
jgi:DNA-binding PadR family transcriptional regulator